MHILEISILFTKSCHRQTYQNYEQPPQRLQNLYIQSHFSASNIHRIFLFSGEEYSTRRSGFRNEIFEFDFLSTLFSKNVPNFCQLWSYFWYVWGLKWKKCLLILNRCIRGLMPNLIKKSWTVSSLYLLRLMGDIQKSWWYIEITLCLFLLG